MRGERWIGRAARTLPSPSGATLPAAALLAFALLAFALLAAAPAGADVFGPISLVSEGALGAGQTQQAEYTHDPAISADGRYIAFDGSFGGVTGVWRRDLTSGAIEQVAGGDAELPSISADGRYVSFTTNEGATLPAITDGRPDEHSQQEAANVYVRDMDAPVPVAGRCEPPPQACPFIVVSAANESTQPLTYAEAGTSLGSAAVGRSAVGEGPQGLEVVFVTSAVSNLVRYPQEEEAEIANGETPKPHTPALQVAVRYLDADRTVLVSGRYREGATSEEPVSAQEGGRSYGAVYAGGGEKPPGFAPPPPYGQYGSSPPLGASISADGSTVAWMGEDVGEQAPLLPGETRAPLYVEPLWRRIAPGSQTPTERITGGSDADNPACAASGERSLPATPSPGDSCQGPFRVVEGSGQAGGIWAGGAGDFVPRLSADGYTVAFLSQAPLVSLGEDFGRGASGQDSDLYVADMHGGLTRDQALMPLTELAGGESAGNASTAPIFDFDVSPDGGEVAFTTKRTQFPLGLPAFVSPVAGEPGMDELFDVDLRNGTLTRVSRGYEGGPSEQPHAHVRAGEDPYGESEPGLGALSPSFTANGGALAFSSTASNLVYGDGNTPPLGEKIAGSADGGDTFVVERIAFAATATPQLFSGAPAGPLIAPAWSLGVSALSRPDGSVVLYVRVPGAGTLHASSRGAIVVRAGSRRARRAERASNARGRIARGGGSARARRAGRAHGKPARLRATVATRTVARSFALDNAAGGELATLVLRLARPYAALASQRGGFSATASIAFGAAGMPILRASVPVTFVRTALRPRRAGARR